MSEPRPPIWWPPKIDDLYHPYDPLRVKIATAIGGWFAFVVIYGGLIFLAVWLFESLGSWT